MAWQRTTAARRFGELKDDLVHTRHRVRSIELRLEDTAEEFRRHRPRGIRRILILIDPERARQQRLLQTELRRLEEDRATLRELMHDLESRLDEARQELTAADRGRRS